MSKKLYALYNHDEELCFVGTSEECCEFVGCSRYTFQSSKSRGHYLKAQYRAYYVGHDVLEQEFKKCSHCKEIKPIDQFYFEKSNNRFSSWCRQCIQDKRRERC